MTQKYHEIDTCCLMCCHGLLAGRKRRASKPPWNATSAAPPLFQCVRGRCLRLMRTDVLSGFGCFEYCQLFGHRGPASQKSSEERFLFFCFFLFFKERSNRLRILLTDRLSGLGVFFFSNPVVLSIQVHFSQKALEIELETLLVEHL